jgi:hypothetical protein
MKKSSYLDVFRLKRFTNIDDNWEKPAIKSIFVQIVIL